MRLFPRATDIRRPRRYLALAAAATAVVAVAIPTGAAANSSATSALSALPASADRSSPAANIAWQPCTDPDFASMDCGTMKAPVDYAHPGGPQVTLSLVRHRASDSAHRIGAVVLNDGAGGSSIEQFRYALRFGLAQTPMAQRFDVIAMDPRGVGHSQGIHCTRPAKAPGITDLPTSQAQFDALVANNQAFAADCLKANGPLLTHMDMASTARDFERLRVGLHETQLNWYGIQYSDLLGRTYAQLFPGRLRTMLLDTALDDALPPTERLATEMATAEQAFDRFAGWCHDTVACALHGQDVAAVYDQLVAKADRTPIPVKGTGQSLTGQDIQAATQDFLVIKSVTWSTLGTAIQQALAGDATAFTHDVDKTLDHTQLQVSACLDQPPAATTYAGLAQLEMLARQTSPHLGGLVQSWTDMTGCLGWPVAARSTAPSGPVKHAPPALILESTHQTLSAYSWAFGLAAQLPGSSVLSIDGDDYSTYITSPCAASNANSYLVDRTLPAAGTLCAY
ncbi:pimeloyl-ACP methyl ester carboxylesterase [Catenulispora sp. EB89]|uniref:alpha/beta fold hydrolase n=1 Tax=Catenulispora sp. EB89 TaxID=3156257 RepID=UPI003512007E